jgi:hypothetical protein
MEVVWYIPIFIVPLKNGVCVTLRNGCFLLWLFVVSSSPNYQPEVPPNFGRPQPLIEYILSYTPYLEVEPSIFNGR